MLTPAAKWHLAFPGCLRKINIGLLNLTSEGAKLFWAFHGYELNKQSVSCKSTVTAAFAKHIGRKQLTPRMKQACNVKPLGLF